MSGLGLDMVFLSAGRRIEPQGDPSIAVVIDRVSRKGFATNPEIR